MGRGGARYTEAYTAPSSGARVPAREIVHLPVAEVARYRWATPPATRRGRGSDRHDYEALKADMAENGMTAPITLGEVQGSIRIHDGHHRLLAAEELGWSHVPVALHENLGRRRGSFKMGSLGA